MMNKLFVLVAATLLLSSCHYSHRKHVSGNGPTVNEQRSLSGFTAVETRGSINIIVRQGDFNVKVEADQTLMQYIETVVENGRLVVRFRQGISIGDYHDANVFVTAPEWSVVETAGSGNIRAEEKITGKDKIDVNISGSGDIELKLDYPVVQTHTHGSGNITLRGEAKNVSTETSGSGDVEASDLKAEIVRVSIHGSGNTEVYASESLDIEVTGSGDVHYKGEPKIATAVHGSGSVNKMD